MKKILVAICLLMSSTFMFTNTANASNPKCRKAVYNIRYDISLTDRVESDLVNGIWNLKIANLERGEREEIRYQFNELGWVDIVSMNNEGQQNVENVMWRVEEYNNLPFLILTNPTDGKERMYQVEQTCDGVNLLDIVGYENLSFHYIKNVTEADINSIRNKMVGNWTHEGYPFDIAMNMDETGTFEPMEGAYMTFHFDANGTFTRKLGAHTLSIKHNGFWEVSKDGKYVFFYISPSNNPEDITETMVAEIAQLEEGRLKFYQKLTNDSHNKNFDTAYRAFHFTK